MGNEPKFQTDLERELYEALAEARIWLSGHAGLSESLPVMRQIDAALVKARGEA